MKIVGRMAIFLGLGLLVAAIMVRCFGFGVGVSRLMAILSAVTLASGLGIGAGNCIAEALSLCSPSKNEDKIKIFPD